MRNMLAFAAALGITFGVAGWYLDWYKIQSTPSTTGHHNVNVDINTKKIGEDIKRGEEKLIEKGSQKLQETAEKSGADEAGRRAESLKLNTSKQTPQE